MVYIYLVDNTLRYFKDNNYKPKNYYIDELTYSVILDNIVVACIDVVVRNSGQVLIVRRVYFPQKDWWIIGGRMSTGESPQDTASRHVDKDLKICCKPTRFKYLTHFYGSWSLRAHNPISNGTQTHSSVLLLDISDSEKDSIILGSEYTALTWVEPKELKNPKYHPLLNYISSFLI